MQNAFNWRDAKLGDICTLRAESIDPARATGLPYVGLEHLDSGQPTLTRHGSPTEVRSLKNRFYRGDILYGKLRPYLDKAVCADREGICSTDILVFKPDTVALSSFLIHLVHNRAFVEHAVKTTKGVNHPRTSWHSLSEFEFRLPSTEEQDAIARTLAAVQRAKEARQRELALERERKSALMEYLFSRGVRGEPTRPTEIGQIPESWKLVRLEELAVKITDGTHWTPTYVAEGVPFLRVVDIQSDKIDWGGVKRIPKAEHDELILRCKPQRGDILLSKNGTIGLTKVVNWDEEFSIFVSLCLIKPRKETLDSTFLAEFLASNGLPQIQKRGKKMTVTNLHLVEIKELLIPVPSISEQREISNTLRAANHSDALLETEVALLGELFRAMLEELMAERLSAVTLVEENQAR